MIVENKNPTVSLRVSGNRTDLNRLSSENISVIVDLAQIYEPGTHEIMYSYYYPGDVSATTTPVIERNPGVVTLVVEKRISKNVDVVINYTGKLPGNGEFIYDKENVELDNTQIMVTGPQSVIDQITQAVITVDLNDRRESFSEQLVYTLCDENGAPVDVAMVTTNVESVNLMLKIHMVKEVPLTYTVIDGGGATADTSSITVEPRSIKISGSRAQVEELKGIELGTIELGKILKDTQLTFDIVLPEGVNNETGITEAVVDVEFPSLMTKTLAISDIRAENVPEGMKVDMLTQVLEIMLRGPRNTVKDMKPAHVTVSVDFSSVTNSSTTWAVEISFAEGFESVGAVGNYSVSATLKDASEVEDE